VLDKFFAASENQRVKRMTGTEQERQETREVAEASLRATQVEVLVRLPDFHVPMRSLATLAEGSVLPTAIPVDAPLEVHVGGTHRYLAESGRVGKKLAVRITEARGVSSALAPARIS
jgi:flagellar motor switch protein FliM